MSFFSAILIFLLGVTIILAAASAKIIVVLLPILFIFFLFKNIVQDIIFGGIKNRICIGKVIFYLICDVARIVLFFGTFKIFVDGHLNADGLSYFFSIIVILLYGFLGGAIFLGGELMAVCHSGGFAELDKDSLISPLAGEIAIVLLLGVIFVFTIF